MRVRTPFSLCVAAAVLFVSCGSESPDSAPTTADTTTTTTDVTTTTAGAVVEETFDIDEFCAASLEYAVRSDATELAEEGNVVVLATLIESSVEALVTVVEVAPSEEFTEEPLRLLDLLAIAIDEFATIDFDVTRAEELSGEFFEAADEIDAIESDLDSFLLDECGIDIADFEADALQYALGVAIGSQEFIELTDDTGNIAVDVPIEWIDIDGAPDGSATFLVAAPSFDAFAASNGGPGIFISSFDSAEVGWEQQLDDEAAFWIDEVGCSVEDDVPYDDATYLGAEVVLSCPETTAVTRLIGGTNADGSVSFLIVLIHPEGRVDIRDRVEETVFVDLLGVGAAAPAAPEAPEDEAPEAAPAPPPAAPAPAAAPKPPTASPSALCPNGYQTVAAGTYPVRPCQKGEAVEVVQQLLRDLGYNISVDGFWGEGTAAALRAEFGENITELLPADIEALRNCDADC